MNLPNKLTIIRIVLTPVFLFLYQADFIPHNLLLSLIVFVAASLTDMADGKIARKHNLITNFGKIADPIADKILTTAILLCFMEDGLCSPWIILIILTREFTVSAIRITAAAQGSVIPANMFGKIKTASQMTFSIMILAVVMFEDEGLFSIPYFDIISSVLLWITAVLTIVSGVIYIKDSAKVIDFSK